MEHNAETGKLNKPIYLDYAAATPLDEAVEGKMRLFERRLFYNPSALYGPARLAAEAITAARQQVAQCLGVRPAEIVFTSGGTESNNLAIGGVMANFPQANLVLSSLEHDSVVRPASVYAVRIANSTKQGFVDLTDLVNKIDDQTVLVSVTLASNEIGTIQSLAKISQLLEPIRTLRVKRSNHMPLLLHTDACQAGNCLKLNLNRYGCDLMSLSAAKLYGPRGAGLLVVKAGTPLRPLLLGGGQETGRRSGTENGAGIIGLAEALRLAQSAASGENRRLQELQQLLVKLLGETLPGCRINGSLGHCLPSHLNLFIPGQDNERLVLKLDSKGLYCGAGSACHAASGRPSSVLPSIGLSDVEVGSSIRLTMGRETTANTIRRAVAVLAAAVKTPSSS